MLRETTIRIGKNPSVSRACGSIPRWQVLASRTVKRFGGTKEEPVSFFRYDAIGLWESERGWLVQLDSPLIAVLDDAIKPYEEAMRAAAMPAPEKEET